MDREELDRIHEKMETAALRCIGQFRNQICPPSFADISAAYTLIDEKLKREEMIAKIGGSR